MKDADLDQWVQQLLDITRRMFEECGFIQAHAVVLGTRDPNTDEPLPRPAMIYVGGELQTSADKDRLAATMRTVAVRSAAIAVAFIAESWTLTMPGLSGAEARREAHRYGEIADHPGRREVIYVSIERRCTGRAEIWSAEITRPNGPDGKAVLEPFIQKKHPGTLNVTGRFTHFVEPAN